MLDLELRCRSFCRQAKPKPDNDPKQTNQRRLSIPRIRRSLDPNSPKRRRHLLHDFRKQLPRSSGLLRWPNSNSYRH